MSHVTENNSVKEEEHGIVFRCRSHGEYSLISVKLKPDVADSDTTASTPTHVSPRLFGSLSW